MRILLQLKRSGTASHAVRSQLLARVHLSCSSHSSGHSVNLKPFEKELEQDFSAQHTHTLLKWQPIRHSNEEPMLSDSANVRPNRNRRILDRLGPDVPKSEYFELPDETPRPTETIARRKIRSRLENISGMYNTKGMAEEEEEQAKCPRSKAFHVSNNVWEEYKKKNADVKVKMRQQQLVKKYSMIMSRGAMEEDNGYFLERLQETSGKEWQRNIDDRLRTSVDTTMEFHQEPVDERNSLRSARVIKETQTELGRKQRRNNHKPFSSHITCGKERERFLDHTSKGMHSEQPQAAAVLNELERENVSQRKELLQENAVRGKGDQASTFLYTDIFNTSEGSMTQGDLEVSSRNPDLIQLRESSSPSTSKIIPKGNGSASDIVKNDSTYLQQFEEKTKVKHIMTENCTSELDFLKDGRNVTWVLETPEALAVQKELLKAKSTQDIFRVVECQKMRNFNPLNSSTALVKLAKADFRFIRDEPRVEMLLQRVGQQLESMTVTSVTNVLWSITRMKLNPQWLPRALERCDKEIKKMAPAQISSCLNSVTRLTFPSPVVTRLLQSLIHSVSERLNEFSSISDFCSILIPLAHLKVRDAQLWTRISEIVNKIMSNYDLVDLASIAWSFARVKDYIDPQIFKTICKRVEGLLETAAVEDLISLCWSLSISKAATPDFLRFHMTPTLQTFLVTLDASQLTKVAWAYANSSCADENLMTDLLFSLIPKVQELTAKEVSALCWSFGRLRLGHSDFFRTLASHAVQVSSTFKAHDIPKALLGFGISGVRNDEVFEVLWEEASSYLENYSPIEILDMLSGTTQPRISKEYSIKQCSYKEVFENFDVPAIELSTKTLSYISTTLNLLHGRLNGISTKKSTELLRCLCVFRHGLNSDVMSIMKLANEAADNVYHQVHSSKNILPETTFTLIRSLSSLHLSDTKLLEECLSHCAALLRSTTMNLAGLCEFLRACRCREPDTTSFRLFLSHLHRRLSVQTSFTNILKKYSPSCSDSISEHIEVISLLSSLGLDETFTKRRHEVVLEFFLKSNSVKLDLPELARLLVAQAQTGASSDWTHMALKTFLVLRYGVPKNFNFDPTNKMMARLLTFANDGLGGMEAIIDEGLKKIETSARVKERGKSGGVTVSKVHSRKETLARRKIQTDFGDAFISLAWICLVLEEYSLMESYMHRLVEDALRCYDENSFPSNILMAQQVCLHLSRLKTTSNNKKSKTGILFEVAGDNKEKDFIDEMLNYRRADFSETPNTIHISRLKQSIANEKQVQMSKFKIGDFPCAVWLSDTLTREMKIKHKVNFTVGNIYSVPIAFPQLKHLIDVYGFSDLTVPNCVPLKVALLRQIQLSELGWTVHPLHLRDVHTATTEGSLTVLLAKILVPVLPECKRFLNYHSADSVPLKNSENTKSFL